MHLLKLSTEPNFFSSTGSLFHSHAPLNVNDLLKNSVFTEVRNKLLQFTVYGRKQASKQASIHTHVRNAVPLVWGSLRLTPIT